MYPNLPWTPQAVISKVSQKCLILMASVGCQLKPHGSLFWNVSIQTDSFHQKKKKKKQKMRKGSCSFSLSTSASTSHPAPAEWRPWKPRKGPYLQEHDTMASPQPKTKRFRAKPALRKTCWITRSAPCLLNHGIHHEEGRQNHSWVKGDQASKQGMKKLMVQAVKRRH